MPLEERLLVQCGDSITRKMAGVTLGGRHAWLRANHLCQGMQMLQRASCADLSNNSFVQLALEKTGLSWDVRKSQLYGPATYAMIRSRTGLKLGLWQDPSQFAAALIKLGSAVHEIRTYLEVGCYTGWTACILATFMQRVGHRLRGFIVDLTAHYAEPVLPLLRSRNLTFVLRRDVPANKTELLSRLELDRSQPQLMKRRGYRVGRHFSLCFIDAQHSYMGIMDDFREFSPYCRRALFHDIQDFDAVHLQNFSGGVPAFWQHLTEYTHPHRITQITSQLAAFAPHFGLGIVGPNENGTVEPDKVPLSGWPKWHGQGKARLRQAFCANPKGTFIRICEYL
eukprot:CAMPEP_0119322300 /NCGR_PEP_ID=MMETSP1333-20130426/57769_1 /TAXON_ID=418940 /ORGANISM="Scyphosphaera apsteinii, Strain RCC1455" /LENGTH=338 /DNA_ID=CAMNT_0007329491 /DNA_START=102 /DNA_END=1118 /DNA_ORIENTATION=-